MKIGNPLSFTEEVLKHKNVRKELKGGFTKRKLSWKISVQNKMKSIYCLKRFLWVVKDLKKKKGA